MINTPTNPDGKNRDRGKLKKGHEGHEGKIG